MEPRIVHRKALTVVGMKCRSNLQDNTIPRLWDDFNQRCKEIPDSLEKEGCYGICYYDEGDEPGGKWFSYLASVEVTALENIPTGMEARQIPESDHAVFEHHGSLDTLQQTYHEIYNKWLPNSEFRMAGTQDFEYYDQRFKYGQTDSVLEIWIPVQPN